MRHRKIILGISIGLLTMAMTSCSDNSFLDETVTTSLTKEEIFSDSIYTVGFLNHVYEDAGFDVAPNRFGGGGL